MYLRNDGFSGYDRNGEQIRQRGLFLVFCQPPFVCGQPTPPIKCAVRKVALQQFGAWMMGRIAIYGERYTVSGAYGHDGLPMTVSQAVYDRLAVTLSSDLHEAWNKGGGWNSAGLEATDIRQWALDNLASLQR